MRESSRPRARESCHHLEGEPRPILPESDRLRDEHEPDDSYGSLPQCTICLRKEVRVAL